MGDEQFSHTGLMLRRALSLVECSPVAILKFSILFEYKAPQPHTLILHWVPQLCSQS